MLNGTVKKTESTECDICYQEKNEFWECNQCQRTHCSQCFIEIYNTSQKCPFCRIPVSNEKRVDINVANFLNFQDDLFFDQIDQDFERIRHYMAQIFDDPNPATFTLYSAYLFYSLIQRQN